MVVVEGTKVRLRPLEAADLPRVFEWYSDPDLVAPYDRFFTDTYDSFAESVREASADMLSLAPRFAVEPLGAHGAVGVVGHYVSHPVLQTVEVWYLIGDASARGRGYGREAVGLLVDHVFRTTSVERVGATCDVENTASCRLVEGLGFQREGTLRSALYHHARWHDAHLYGVTRAERSTRSRPG
ncbi:MAG TPA: GNAT family protein [Thermoplasmata archaeon]|nr:GNAT family protein [Thermoplasmata archaeon]